MKSKRPEIQNIVNSNTKEKERFQNTVLRPILKQQHLILVDSFQAHLKQQKMNFENLTDTLKEKNIDALFSKDIAFKNKQIGMILGRFTREEFLHYNEFASHYNRRILQMLRKRIKDTFL